MKINKFIILVLSIFILFGISTANAEKINGISTNTVELNINPINNFLNSQITHESDIINKYNNTTCHSEISGKCNKVVDGDTIWVEGVGKIRFVGVNTPERGEAGYNESKNFVKELCLNKEVSLDIDDSKHYDKYNRTLAVVIVNGKNLNEMLLKEKLAEVMYIPPSEFNPYSWE